VTSGGERRMRQVVRGLAALDVTIAQVISSPLVRARHTADVLEQGLPLGPHDAHRPPVLVLPELAPGHTPEHTMLAVAEATDARSIALVGHEPDLGLLAGWLLGLDRPLAFKKGGVCRIDVSPWPAHQGGGDLVWFAPPKLLRRVGT